jgi:predicted GNAT superfamily acetyltransferase
MSDEVVTIRTCHTIEEYELMVDLEIEVWKFTDRDVVPAQMYVVASKIGGQALAAFVRGKMAGFILAYPGIRDGKPYLHSHMAAVLPEFSDLGIGRKLKLAQREDALARGISVVEWTFDPLQTKNAYFNICRLGAVARRYLTDVYGSTSSPLHAGLPTDRLVAEWDLRSQRVVGILAGKEPMRGPNVERVRFVMDEATSDRAAEIQLQARERFQKLFAGGYAVTWFEREVGGGSYVLAKP